MLAALLCALTLLASPPSASASTLKTRVWDFFEDCPLCTDGEGDLSAQSSSGKTASNVSDCGGRNLFYDRFRYYDPGLGRYISPDPIGFFGGFNLYCYVTNVTGWADPFGWKPCHIRRKTKKKLLENIPEGMNNPHMHHIVMEGSLSGWSKESRKHVTRARTLLRQLGIDIQGDANVVWAENAGHSVDYARKVLERLTEAKGRWKGGKRGRTQARQRVIKELGNIGDELGSPEGLK